MGYRDRPSEGAYRATRWLDVWDRVGDGVKCFAAFAFATVTIACLPGAIVVIETAKNRCRIECHPGGHKVMSDGCYCLPDDAPAYMAEKVER